MEEIIPERGGGTAFHIFVEKESTEFFARSKDLPTTRAAPSGAARR
jgi:hypothetical protein